MHEGTVHVKSQVGQGTSVTVTLPLLKPVHSSTPNSSFTKTQHSMAASESGKMSAYISTVRQSLKTGTFAIHGFTTSASSLTKASLERYLTQWLEMSPVSESTADSSHKVGGDVEDGAKQEQVETNAPEIIIIDEETLSDYLIQPSGVAAISHLFKARLIVVCDPTRQPQLFKHISASEIVAGILTTPFGPHKLSRVLLASLETPTPSTPIHSPLQSIDGTDRDAGITAALLAIPIPPGPDVQSQTSWPESQSSPIPPIELKPVVNTITLPIRPHDSTGSSTKPFQSNPLRILCVDDNPINLRILKTYLEKLHYTDITCAINGAVAFEAVRKRTEGFELIFMDLSMPVLDGFSCTSMIRGLEKLIQRFPTTYSPTTPDESKRDGNTENTALIVALTGLASQKDQDRAKEAGADHFITKPLKLARLKELLVEWNFALEEPK
jgi:CheY-like chemotaxis protein